MRDSSLLLVAQNDMLKEEFISLQGTSKSNSVAIVYVPNSLTLKNVRSGSKKVKASVSNNWVSIPINSADTLLELEFETK